MSEFASRLIAWQRRYGRHDLPWQNTRDPYPIWVSEIMLQQTQVATVIPYYWRFMAHFPDVAHLAAADEDAVLAQWSGLGYYSRARNLHRAARAIMLRHGGIFPKRLEEIVALPGIGRSTAAAIAAFAFGQRHAILDGNVKRVLARWGGVEGYPGEKAVELALWDLAQALLPERGIEAYTQGIMDLGATVCTRGTPRCGVCPLSDSCVAYAQGRVAELPTPRPRQPLPERETTMLILLCGGDVLLEKRPPTGIWGGLWSLPETGMEEDVPALLHARWGIRPVAERRLAQLSHTFTHFRLRIRPRLIATADCQAALRAPGVMWIALADARHAAIPAPVRKLLAQVQP